MRILLSRQIYGLIVILLFVIIIRTILYFLPTPSPTDDTFPSDSTIASFLHTNTNKDTLPPVSRKCFDPNTADSITLLQQGFRPWQVHNMLRYRLKGGVWRHPADMKKIYGLTDSLYQLIEPYVSIAPLPQDIRRDSLRRVWHIRDSLWQDSIRQDSLRRDSIYRSHHYHPKRDTLIELNAADTDALQYIKGVGSGIARNIVYYRQQLGGFYAADQVREIEGLEFVNWDSIVPHFQVDTDSIHPIFVNRCSLKRLTQHPYIRFSTAKSIYTLRRNRIRLHGMEELQEVLTEEEAARLRPYLDFGK